MEEAERAVTRDRKVQLHESSCVWPRKAFDRGRGLGVRGRGGAGGPAGVGRRSAHEGRPGAAGETGQGRRPGRPELLRHGRRRRTGEIDRLPRRRPAADIRSPAADPGGPPRPLRASWKSGSTCGSAAQDGPAVRTVGPIMHIDKFDEFGRRIITMNTVRGPVDIIQGITEITPEWTKVEGITYMWDMRIATSSIPRDVLHKMLLRQAGDGKDIERAKKDRALLHPSGTVRGSPGGVGGHPRGLSEQHGSEGAIGPDDPFAAATRRGAVARRVEAAARRRPARSWCWRR